MSRRALLGCSGSAAAGTVLASAGSVQAEETRAAEQTSESSPAWITDTPFRGVTPPGPEEGTVTVTFTIDVMSSPTAQNVTPLDVANAINELLTSRGWPAMQFHGAVHTALN
ncbi:hypothetical protein [Streptomyces zaehneri]|uniref:hypothetical protein n=1 Tax=Streptomyces zaehneri TaxID=3051180 RepID=UPI0028D54E1A|nr:hypothetical protein [Streptomyces sp. DSM 40713]